MKKRWLYLFAFASCLGLLYFLQGPNAVAITTGIVSGILVLFIDGAAGAFENIRLWWIAFRYRNQFIRISISYLFRIKVGQQYLLIHSERFPVFQSIGGVYKRFTSSTTLFQKLEIVDDDLVLIDDVSRDDLRIRVKGVHLIEFMNWFNSGKDREISPWREFYEELIRPGYLPSELFPYIFYHHIKRYEHPLRYSAHARSNELLIADIFELELNTAQMESLQRLYESKATTDKLLWVDEERIYRRGSHPGEKSTYEISLHSSWII